MIRSGTVKQIVSTENFGIILDKSGREFYFDIYECTEGKLPELYTFVTFVKDTDFKSTDVAKLVKPSAIGNKAA